MTQHSYNIYPYYIMRMQDNNSISFKIYILSCFKVDKHSFNFLKFLADQADLIHHLPGLLYLLSIT
jgi:hypothetical protein